MLIIDANSNRHAISPYIYGVNEAEPETLRELHVKLNRWGGNRSTRYNWREDATSTAADWYFQNLRSRTPRAPEEEKLKDYQIFIRNNQRNSCDSLLTIPTAGWVAKDDHSHSYSVAKYGPQQAVAPEHKDAGNGVRPDGSFVENDPADTNVPSDASYQREWVKQIVAEFGKAADGGVKYYSLDNEPCLWNQIHRDLHPKPTTYDEIFKLSEQYASAIKEVDPTAQVTGPVVYGWGAYFGSAADNFSIGNDRKAHGGVPFLEWYLTQMQRAEKARGRRLLDVLDVHFYPETRAGSERQRVVLESEEDGDSVLQQARLRATKSLWDAGYEDESWIKQPIRLIPRLKEIVQRTYPGTKIALTEYRWGPYRALSSGLAQADALGIFGREGLDMAAIWNAGAKYFHASPTEFAFKMYCNYDGQGGHFGDLSVAAYSSSQDNLSIYAAVDKASGDLTLVAVNKTADTLSPLIELRNFTGTLTVAYQYAGADLKQITQLKLSAGTTLNDLARSGFAPNSITMLRLSAAHK